MENSLGPPHSADSQIGEEILSTAPIHMTGSPQESGDSHAVPARTLIADLHDFQTQPLVGERVAFTGTLASMTHREATEIASRYGGQAFQHIGQQTTLLVIGDEGWPLEADGRISVKLEQAQQLIEKGSPLRVISEGEWRGLVGLETRTDTESKLYTPVMLSQLLDLPVQRIRKWERMGLISAVKRVNRLPYFHYQEAVAAQKLAELVASGVSPAKIAKSLGVLREMLGEGAQPLSRLEILVRDQAVLYRDAHGLVEPRTGQRRLVFADDVVTPDVAVGSPLAAALPEPSSLDELPTIDLQSEATAHWSAEDWLSAAVHLADENQLSAAEEACRNVLRSRATDPAAHFHLADLLFRQNNLAGALERYLVAVELDGNYVEAWTQLGCTYALLQRDKSAEHALRTALGLLPDLPDGHLHLAEILDRSGRQQEALIHWQRYLDFETRGPWANLARERLADNSQ